MEVSTGNDEEATVAFTKTLVVSDEERPSNDDSLVEDTCSRADNGECTSDDDSAAGQTSGRADNNNNDNIAEGEDHHEKVITPQQLEQMEEQRMEDESLNLIEEHFTYEDTCRLAMRMGVLAIKYGTTSGRVEKFLSSLMLEFGYYGVFLCTLKEIFCTFQRSPEDGFAHTQIVVCSEGINLHKLALLSELVKDVKKKSLTPQEAAARLKAIEQEPNPWSPTQIGTAFLLVGASFAAVFEGCWWDILFGPLCGGLVFLVMTYFESLGDDAQQWFPLTASFLCSTLATVAQAILPEINATLVNLSGLAVLLPGYSVSLGMAELVTGHILSGLSRLLTGAVMLLWLLTGSILGTRMVDAVLDLGSAETHPDPVSKGWYALYVPLLFCSVSVILGNSFRDTPWAILCMFIAFGTSLVANTFMEANLGTFVSSVAMTVFANAWSNRMDRPSTLVLTPAFLVKVSGSIGFLGLVRIVEGETFVGTEQVLQMFLIALLIAAGIFAGNTLVPCSSSL